MKNIILIVSLVLISNCLTAQNYLTENTVWKEFAFTLGGIEHSTYYIEGDTLIDGITYYKTRAELLIYGVPYSYNPSPLREESGVFYYYRSGEDRILHDFNLSVGDNVVSENSYDSIRVVHIDTIYMGDMPRKRFFLNNYDEQDYYSRSLYLIEGIGYSSGIFRQPTTTLVSDYDSRLLCFSQGNQYVAIELDSIPETFQMESGCDSLVSVDGVEIVDFQFQITPNPAQNHINITFDKILPQNTRIQIANIDGKILLQKNISNVQQ